MERCIGCGIAAQSHPMVGIGREDLAAGTGPYVAHPVCDLCWKDPEHRTLGNPKVSYAARAQAAESANVANLLDARAPGAPATIGT